MRRRARTTRVWGSLAGLAVVLTIHPALGDVPTLGAVNTFTSAVPAWMTVRVPAGARMRFGCWDDQGVSMTGGGRVLAFYMRKLNPDPAPDKIQSSMILRYPAEAGSTVFGCTPDLSAGLWEIYVLPDGEPGTVVLNLTGASGSVSLTPTTPAAYHFEMLPSTQFAEYPGMYSAGAGPRTLARRGMVAAWYYFEERNAVISDTGGCFWEGEPQISPIAYAPECPDADWAGSGMFIGPYFGSNSTIGGSGVEGIAGGPWSIGAYALGAQAYDKAIAFGTWLGWD